MSLLKTLEFDAVFSSPFLTFNFFHFSSCVSLVDARPVENCVRYGYGVFPAKSTVGLIQGDLEKRELPEIHHGTLGTLSLTNEPLSCNFDTYSCCADVLARSMVLVANPPSAANHTAVVAALGLGQSLMVLVQLGDVDKVITEEGPKFNDLICRVEVSRVQKRNRGIFCLFAHSF